jgi:hypothetical protein
MGKKISYFLLYLLIESQKTCLHWATCHCKISKSVVAKICHVESIEQYTKKLQQLNLER